MVKTRRPFGQEPATMPLILPHLIIDLGLISARLRKIDRCGDAGIPGTQYLIDRCGGAG